MDFLSEGLASLLRLRTELYAGPKKTGAKVAEREEEEEEEGGRRRGGGTAWCGAWAGGKGGV
jgi:hypothetical protein